MRISTRLHGMIDYSVATLLATLASRPALAPRVRGTLAFAGLAHAGYATQTDYEAGFAPRLTMRQHLALDAIGGFGIGLAGLMMKRQPFAQRALLVALGAAELTAVGLSSSTPATGPGQGGGALGRLGGGAAAPDGQVGYPPLDVPKPVAEGVFIVDSLLPGLLGAILPARMTVIRLADGGLLLHSPTRFSLELKAALEQHGPIRHLVAPNIAHWTFLADWQRHCPDAVTWAAPGLRNRAQVRGSPIRLDHDLPASAPEAWGDGIELDRVTGGLGFSEVTLFHVATRTLVLTDLVLSLEPDKVPRMMRPVVRLFGSQAPQSMPPPYLRAVARMGGHPASEAAARLIDKRPERVIFSHGRWFEQGAAESLRRSLQWLV